MADVLNGICDKLVERHPHVYGDVVAENEEVVKANWEKLKLNTEINQCLKECPIRYPPW